jgi:hypothetical protein
MAAETGNNEGFHVLDDFICEVMPAPGVTSATSPGNGINAGIILSDNDISGSHPRLSEKELRKLSSAQLRNLLEMLGPTLSPEDLQVIHDIAIERLIQNEPAVSEGAVNLSKEAMQVTLHRIT